MADISDVEQAIANTVTSILYPEGSSNLSIIGTLCRVYRGWPNSATLNADLTSGAVNVTVVTDNEPGRTTSRYLPAWQTTLSQPGVTASVTGQIISLSGSPVVGDVVGALIDGSAFAYRIQAGDSAGLIASNLTQLMPQSMRAVAQGLNIIIPGGRSIEVRVVCDAASSFESRRQEKDLRIIFWCPNPLIRDAVASAVDSAMDQMSFLPLPDGSNARVVYRNTASYDQAQNALLYRRDLVYMIEYPTVTTVRSPSMLFGASDLNGNIIYG